MNLFQSDIISIGKTDIISILTANCLIVSFGSLRISLHENL